MAIVIELKNFLCDLEIDRNNSERSNFFLRAFHGFSAEDGIISNIQNEVFEETLKIKGEMKITVNLNRDISKSLSIKKDMLTMGFNLFSKINNAKNEICVSYCGSVYFKVKSDILDKSLLRANGGNFEIKLIGNIINHVLESDIYNESQGRYSKKDCKIGKVSFDLVSYVYRGKGKIDFFDDYNNKASESITKNQKSSIPKVIFRKYSSLSSPNKRKLSEINDAIRKIIEKDYYESCITSNNSDREVIFSYSRYDKLKNHYDIRFPKLGFPLLNKSEGFQVPYYTTISGLSLPAFTYIIRSNALLSSSIGFVGIDYLEGMILSHFESVCKFYPDLSFSSNECFNTLKKMYDRRDLNVKNEIEDFSLQVLFEICNKTVDEPYIIDTGVVRQGTEIEDDMFFSSSSSYGSDCEDGNLHAYCMKKIICEGKEKWKTEILKLFSVILDEFVACSCVIMCGFDGKNNPSINVIKRIKPSGSRDQFGTLTARNLDKGGVCHVACVLFPRDWFIGKLEMEKRVNNNIDGSIKNNHLVIIESTARTMNNQSKYAVESKSDRLYRRKRSLLEDELRDKFFDDRYGDDNIVHVESSDLFDENKSWYNAILDIWTNDHETHNRRGYINETQCFMFTSKINSRKYWGNYLENIIEDINSSSSSSSSSSNISIESRISLDRNESTMMYDILQSNLGTYKVFPYKKEQSCIRDDYRYGKVESIYSMIYTETKNKGDVWKLFNNSYRERTDKYGSNVSISKIIHKNIIKKYKNSENDLGYIRLTSFVGNMNGSGNRAKIISREIIKQIDEIVSLIGSGQTLIRQGGINKLLENFDDIKPIIAFCAPILDQPYKDRCFTKLSFLLFYYKKDLDERYTSPYNGMIDHYASSSSSSSKKGGVLGQFQ